MKCVHGPLCVQHDSLVSLKLRQFIYSSVLTKIGLFQKFIVRKLAFPCVSFLLLLSLMLHNTVTMGLTFSISGLI